MINKFSHQYCRSSTNCTECCINCATQISECRPIMNAIIDENRSFSHDDKISNSEIPNEMICWSSHRWWFHVDENDWRILKIFLFKIFIGKYWNYVKPRALPHSPIVPMNIKTTMITKCARGVVGSWFSQCGFIISKRSSSTVCSKYFKALKLLMGRFWVEFMISWSYNNSLTWQATSLNCSIDLFPVSTNMTMQRLTKLPR